MSQHDMNLADQNGANFRQDVNNALQALASCSAGTTRPATAYAGQVWIKTDYAANTWGIYRIVDQANSELDVLLATIDTTTGQITYQGKAAFSDVTLPAASTGNVSRHVMTTTAATATYWAKLATFAMPGTNNVAGKLSLLITPTADGAHYPPLVVDVSALQGTEGLSASSVIHHISNTEEAVAHNGMMLVTSAATNGTNIELWMKSAVAAKYAVQVLASTFDAGVSITYHDGATWQAAAPTGAVTVTSDWAGGAWNTVTFSNGWSEITGYPVRYKKLANGLVIVKGAIAPGTSGAAAFTLPVGFRPGSSIMFTADAEASTTISGRMIISTSGSVVPSFVGSATYLTVSCMFLAEN